ncbi:MAG: hypothetical protein CK424_01465 [Legionella sp.]|nr:MAG: hypothetical protein CK424_01465 [Legionella sp.]
MMKKIILSFTGFLLYMNFSFALSATDFPTSFSIKADPDCLQCRRLVSGNQTLGELKLAPNKKGTFYYFDDQNQLQYTFILKPKKNYKPLQFDISDQYQQVIAHFNVVPTPQTGMVGAFSLLSEDSKTILFTAIPGLFSMGKLTIKDENRVLGEIVRDFTDLDSEVKITDKQRFLSRAKGVDINILYAALAFNYIGTRLLAVDE